MNAKRRIERLEQRMTPKQDDHRWMVICFVAMDAETLPIRYADSGSTRFVVEDGESEEAFLERVKAATPLNASGCNVISAYATPPH